MKQDPNITTVNMHEAKSGLSRLVQLALDGKRVQIARHGKPVAELRQVESEVTEKKSISLFIAVIMSVRKREKIQKVLPVSAMARFFHGNFGTEQAL